MITDALHPASAPSPHVDAEWVAVTAARVLAAVEEHRSTWQSWHVRAEAQRHSGPPKSQSTRLIN
jgi:hypothetical protein